MIRNRRILAVDDEPDNVSVLKMALEDEGFAVDAFTDSLLALSTFKPRMYDLLIFDIKMPTMNGFELYEKMKQLDNKIKVCFLTAFGEGYYEELKRRFPESSDVYFLRKPIRLNDLVKKINEFI
jgi:CheY-like chemotaxis protein